MLSSVGERPGVSRRGVSPDTRAPRLSSSSCVPSSARFICPPPPPPWPPPSFFRARASSITFCPLPMLSVVVLAFLFSLCDFELRTPRPVSCFPDPRHLRRHSFETKTVIQSRRLPVRCESRTTSFSAAFPACRPRFHCRISPLLFSSARSSSESSPVTTAVEDHCHSVPSRPSCTFMHSPCSSLTSAADPPEAPSSTRTPFAASSTSLHHDPTSSFQEPWQSSSFFSLKSSRSFPWHPSFPQSSPPSQLLQVHSTGDRTPRTSATSSATSSPPSSPPFLRGTLAFLSSVTTFVFVPSLHGAGSLCTSSIGREREDKTGTGAVSVRTRLHARRKQLKGAKRWNRRRPTKTRPSQINPKPVPWIPSIQNFLNAPPEYLPAPSSEGEDLLKRPKISYLLYLLWLLPQRCKRGSSAFLPSPSPSSLPKPKPICQGCLRPSETIRERMEELQEYEDSLSLQHEQEKQSIEERLSRFLQECQAEEHASTQTPCAVSSPPSSSSSGSPSPSASQRPVVNAAAAWIETEEAKEIQRLSRDPELLADLESLRRFAYEKDDLALRLIHEHLVTAVSPVSIPPYISEKRSFLPQEDKTFLADRREHLAKTTSVLHHHHHHAPASSSSASLLHVAFSSTEHSRDREAEIERPDESEGEGKKPRDGRDESSEEDERAQRDRSSQEDLKEGAPGGAAMRKEEEEKEEGKKKKKNRKDGRLPLHLRKARERYESATYLVRSVSHSPLTRFNRLLLAEAIDRWWKAWQLRRFAGLLKKKFKTLKHLGRQMQAGGMPPETLLEEDAFERYHLLDDLPRTHFVSNYLRRHSQTFSLSLRPSFSSSDTTHAGQRSDVPSSPVTKSPEKEEKVLTRKRQQLLREKAFEELKEIGLLDPEGNLDVDKLRELYGVQPNTYKRARERKEEDERRRCLPRDRVSKQERHQQLKFREAALEMLTNPSDSQQRQGADLRWKEREEDEKIGGKIARATAVFDALLREQFPDYKPITDPYQLETYLEAEYRVHSLKRDLRKMYADWLQAGMPDEPKQPNKNDFLVYWMSLSKRQRKKLLYEEKEKAPKDASNAELMKRIKKKVLLQSFLLHSGCTPQGAERHSSPPSNQQRN